MTEDVDSVAEVEARVAAILAEHLVLWGCDDPSCAIRCSNYVALPEQPTRWEKFIERWCK